METSSGKKKDEKQPHAASETDGADADTAKQQEPGTGGVAKSEYDKATEKAVKDIHG